MSAFVLYCDRCGVRIGDLNPQTYKTSQELKTDHEPVYPVVQEWERCKE